MRYNTFAVTSISCSASIFFRSIVCAYCSFITILFQAFFAIITFAACNSKSDLNTNKDVILTDTSSMYRSNMMTDTGSVIETSALTTGTSTAVANRRATNTNRATTYPTRRNNTNRNYGNTSRNSNSGSSNSGNTVPQRKRGWSKAAKGAVIGGVGGAVVGGVVKGGKGAIVGGAVGAAGGYILGRSKDKKEGRVR